MNPEPDQEPEIRDDVEGHMFVPPDERGGGHPTGSDRPRDARVEEPGV